MSDKKNIDRLYQEKFKDFEVQPPASVWNAIDRELDQKKHRKVLPLWWKFAGVAAVLAVLFSSLYLGMNNDKLENRESIVNIEKENKEGNSIKKQPDNKESLNDFSTRVIENDMQENQLAIDDFTIDNDRVDVNTNKNEIITKNNFITSQKGSSDINSNNKQNKVFTNNSVLNSKPNAHVGIAQNENVIKEPINQGKITKPAGTVENSIVNDAVAGNKNNYKTAFIEDHNRTLDQDKELLENAAVGIDSTKKSLPTLEEIASQEEDNDSVRNNIFKGRWAASTQVGPVYSNSMNGSAVNDDVANNERSAGYNLSYGLGLSYEISPRLSVRTGINQVNMSYSTQDVNYQIDFAVAARDNVVASQVYDPTAVRNSAASNSLVSNNSLQAGSIIQEFTSGQFQGIKGELSQQVGYIEVPLELQYSLLNRKFKINVVGGMSALFLTDNIVSVQNSGERLELGEDTNFNDFNQSANFGLGLGYDFTRQLGAFIEPTFKYQLNALRNNTADFRPYTIGVQSGVIYRF